MILFLLVLGFATESPTILVTNPMEPGAHRIVFEEDLRFGGGSGENELWSDGQTSVFFSVNSAGHFFICDIKATTILEFDSKGKFVRNLGIKGEGPGEYQNIASFHVLANGQMIGHDSMRAVSEFTYYDKDGNIVDTKSINDATKMLRRTRFSPDGQHFFSGFMSRNQATRSVDYKTGYFNADFTAIKVLSEKPQLRPAGPPRFDDPEWWTEMIAGQLKDFVERGVVFIRFLPNNDVLMVTGKHYEIEKWSPDLKTKLMHIKKEFEPIPFQEEDKKALVDWLRESIFEQSPQLSNIITTNVLNKATEKANLPLVQVPIADILPMKDGHFLTVHETSFKTGKIGGHIFDSGGHCIGSYDFPGLGVYDLFGTRVTFSNGFAYAMEHNEDGDNVMVRYKYKITRK